MISIRKPTLEDGGLRSKDRQSEREREIKREREAGIADQCRSSNHSTVSATSGSRC